MPFCTWALTGLFFLVRPAYDDAYKTLSIQTYPQLERLELPVSPQWQEYRFLKSILGDHLLVRTSEGWLHLDAVSGEQQIQPSRDQLERLVSDAIRSDPDRYGDLERYEGEGFQTTTGVEITLDWHSLSLAQRGRDTFWINQIYDIHYLRWTGVGWVDEVVGVSGLLLLFLMTLTGMRMLLISPARKA